MQVRAPPLPLTVLAGPRAISTPLGLGSRPSWALGHPSGHCVLRRRTGPVCPAGVGGLGPQRWSVGGCAEPRPRAQTALGPGGPVRSGCMPRLHRLAGLPHRRCRQPPPEGRAGLGTEWIRFFLGRLQSGIHIPECTGCEHAPGQTPGSSGVTVGWWHGPGGADTASSRARPRWGASRVAPQCQGVAQTGLP